MGLKLFLSRTPIAIIIWLAVFAVLVAPLTVSAATSSGSVGIEAKVAGNPPKNAPTITFPSNNSSFTTLPIRVTGLCQSGLLVKVFKNNVFGGSAVCQNGSYSVEIDLFAGRNELTARAYDDLEQSSPPSNKVIVNFPISTFSGTNRVSLSSAFAKRGASPGSKLSWPIILSGGNGPYAITVDWGDGKRPDVISREFAGTFDITHVYDSAGVYNILVRASDKNGETAFLQLVGVGNGEIADTGATGTEQPTKEVIKVVWWPVAVFIPLAFIAFWLGRKHELFSLRKKLERR
ncbi:MAG TPA: hypothetical protein VFX86_02890 [Candidatus Saccharimonadales bacterium]|nr:hypothetical protein [Candidatus Saccharimonadales bacterium]